MIQMILNSANEQLEVFKKALGRILDHNQYSVPTYFRNENQTATRQGPRHVDQPKWVIVPNTPLLLADLDNKTGAGKRGLEKLAVCVDGSYTVTQVGDEQSVLHYTASTSIFKYPPDKPRTLDILDAWHYDFAPDKPDGEELPPNKIVPHAMFHAQRGISESSLSKLRSLLDQRTTNVKAMQSAQLPDDLSQKTAAWPNRIRVPTPRMDWFGVTLVILADLVLDLTQDEHQKSFKFMNASFPESSPLNNLLQPDDEGCPNCFPPKHSCLSNWYRSM